MLGALLLAVLQGMMAVRDRLFKFGVDAAVAGDESKTARIVVWILVLVVVAAGVRVLSRLTVFYAGRNAEYELRGRMLAHLHRLGYSFFSKTSVGDIMSRATNDLGQVRLLLGFGVLNISNTVFALISALTVMLQISVELTAAALAPFPLLVLVSRIAGRIVFLRTQANQAALGQLSQQVQSSLAGVRIVRAFSLESSEQKAFDQASDDFLQKALSLARAKGVTMPMMGAVAAIGMLVSFWYGGHLVLQETITQGDFVAFWSALARLTWPIIALGLVISIVQRGRASYRRIKEILEVPPDIVDGTSGALATVRGELTLKGLRFSYGDHEVLRGVDLHVEAGHSVAIVGRVGSGKSTLAALLARLLPCESGMVFLDGVDVTSLPLETVRRAVGFSQQDAFLFSTTVARNIGFTLDDADSAKGLELIRDAASEAQILQEVMRLSDGLDSVVGERGLQLSAGQKQRVALARCLLYHPAILVLDDPLSAVDARTEHAILEAIERQKKQRTVVLITSRVAAAATCDQIVVLDQGRIVERGTHAELERAGGVYAQFVQKQRIERQLELLRDSTDFQRERAASR